MPGERQNTVEQERGSNQQVASVANGLGGQVTGAGAWSYVEDVTWGAQFLAQGTCGPRFSIRLERKKAQLRGCLAKSVVAHRDWSLPGVVRLQSFTFSGGDGH